MEKRILLTISYDGSAYSGWQRQLNAPSIQQEIEEALEKIAKKPITLYGASRTDSGVHAKGQAAHFNMDTAIKGEKFAFILNTLLPQGIRILRSKEISPFHHARYSACGKMYTYRIFNHPQSPGMFHQYYAHVPVKINLDLIKEAIPPLLGSHDFAAFCARGAAPVTTQRHMYAIDVYQNQEQITFTFCGNAFLYNMVRILAGTLIEIGQKRLPKEVLFEALESKNRLILGPTAPSKGLELTRVFYPWDEDLPFVPIKKELLIKVPQGVTLYE